MDEKKDDVNREDGDKRTHWHDAAHELVDELDKDEARELCEDMMREDAEGDGKEGHMPPDKDDSEDKKPAESAGRSAALPAAVPIIGFGAPPALPAASAPALPAAAAPAIRGTAPPSLRGA